MVEDPVGAVVVRIGSSDDANHRQILAVSSGNGVEDAESSDGEGDDASTDAPGTRVSVGGIASVEFVAAADEVEAWLGDEVVEQRQVEVAGDGEDVPDAYLNEAASQVAAECAVEGGGSRGGLSRCSNFSSAFHVWRFRF